MNKFMFILLIAVNFVTFSIKLPAQSFLPIYERGFCSFEVDFEIGGDIDDEDYFLYLPTDMDLDSHGNLFILDYKGYCIKKFSPAGEHLITFGRKGEGPGEMLGAYRIAVDPNDNVVIYDRNNRRFSFFDNDGIFLKSSTLTEIGWKFISDFDIDLNGNIFIAFIKSDFTNPHNKSLVSISRIRLEPFEETIVDSLYIKTSYVSNSEGGGMTFFSAPFHPRLFWGIMPSGNIIIANSNTYKIMIYSNDLSLLSEKQFDSKKLKVTSKDREDYFNRFENEDTKELARKTVDFPKYKPHFVNLHIDHEGYILFQLNEGEEDSLMYHVFTPEGDFINKIKLPKLHNSAILSEGYIYNRVTSEDMDPVVYRYRLKER